MAESSIQQQVQAFYNAVGWKQIGPGVYQNARYEDLRPVSRDYIHNCHMRVKDHIAASGDLLLDAGGRRNVAVHPLVDDAPPHGRRHGTLPSLSTLTM